MNYLERDDSVEEYSTDQIIDNAIEWIETLCRNDYRKAKGKLTNMGGFCCYGVARNVLGWGGLSLDHVDILNFEDRAMGLMHGGRNNNQLWQFNDGDNGIPPLTHPEIAKQMITHADGYFEPEVAEAIQRHFFLNEDAS